MATEKIIPIIIDVKPDPALVKNLAQIKTNISAIDAEISNLGKQSKAAIKQGATKDAQGLNEEIIRLSQARKELKDSEKDLQKQIDNTGKAFKSSLAEAGSYNQLSSRLTVLINQYKTLGDTKTPSAKALLGEINSIQDQLTETDTELRNFKSNVGNYEKAILQALKNAGDEKGLKKQTDEIKKRNEELKSQAANLTKQYEDTFKKTGKLAEEARTKIGQQLTKINDDIAKNEKTLEQFQKGGITAKQGGKVAKTGARLLGQKAIGGLATGVVESAGALGSLGPAGIAAFGVFAAGGLVFKGVQALEQLAAGINKTTAEVQRLSGASVEEAKGLTDEVRTLAVAFGENEDAVLENVKQIQEGLGISFTEAQAHW